MPAVKMKTENNLAVLEWLNFALIPFYNVRCRRYSEVYKNCIKSKFTFHYRPPGSSSGGIKWQSNEVFWLGISKKDCVYMSRRLQAKQISGGGNSYPHWLLMRVHRWTPLAVNCGDKFADCTSCITVNQGATLFAESLENSSPWRLSKKWVVNFQLLIWWRATSPLPRCGWRAIHGALWVTPGCQSPAAPQAFTPAEESGKITLATHTSAGCLALYYSHCVDVGFTILSFTLS